MILSSAPAPRRLDGRDAAGRSPPLPPRSFLFLQGLASRFFARLAAALRARGHTVHRVNFNGGDKVFWRLPGAIDYRGRLADWPAFFDRLLFENGISDVVLFGDCRPVHRAAVRAALGRPVRVHVVEEGYLRPGWITFEEGGVNGYSALPRDPHWYLEQADSLPLWRDPPVAPGSFARRAFEDVLYTLTSLALAWRFPHYETHRPYHPLIEYAGWVRRLALLRGAERQAAAAIAGLREIEGPLFLFPLQLDDDYQVRAHSPARAMLPAMHQVLASFARHAPRAAHLIVKLHPLDSGLVNWGGLANQLAAEYGIARRLCVLDGGELDALIARCRGVVTVNSTVGTLALRSGIPTIALGRAVYDMPGLTFQGRLDEFWAAPQPPDARLVDAFSRVLAARCLIPGGFFSEAGLTRAVDAAVGRLEAGHARPVRGVAQDDDNALLVNEGGGAIAAASPSR